MIFSSYWFVCALPIFLVFYAISESKLRTILLVVFCILFHAHFAGAAGVMPIAILGLLTYSLAFTKSRATKIVGIVACVAALIFYKYTHFICVDMLGLLNRSLGQLCDATSKQILPETAPLAISFFVFEFIHYLWDVRKGSPAISNPWHFLQFALFFPSLVAGPIKRYEQFLPALQKGKDSSTVQDFAQGIVQVAGGFFKKSVLADNLALYINSTAPNYSMLNLQARWLFVLAVSLRIYFDFSGYSDIAIGIARMMGVELPVNFNFPYVAKNLQEFWHRWHISLSLWIRDYVYIPLGGSRKGKFHTILNGLTAFALCGLWHGAAWNFLCWGVYHGLGLGISTNYRKNTGNFGRAAGTIFDKLPFLAWFTTFVYVCCGWLLFFYPLGQAANMFKLLFTAAAKF